MLWWKANLHSSSSEILINGTNYYCRRRLTQEYHYRKLSPSFWANPESIHYTKSKTKANTEVRSVSVLYPIYTTCLLRLAHSYWTLWSGRGWGKTWPSSCHGRLLSGPVCAQCCFEHGSSQITLSDNRLCQMALTWRWAPAGRHWRKCTDAEIMA